VCLAIGLQAPVAGATFLFRKPGHLARALLAMYVIMPADRRLLDGHIVQPESGGDDRVGGSIGFAKEAGAGLNQTYVTFPPKNTKST